MALLEHKVAIITGGSTGIGRAIAGRYAREGARLVLAARSEAKLKLARNEVQDLTPEKVAICPTDVADADAVSRLMAFTLDSFSTIDILVNSAGIYGPIGLVTDIDSHKWLETIKINLFGTFLCMQAVLPTMMKNNHGKIINMSGGGAVAPFPRFSAYSTAKAGVVRLTETLAQEVREYNISINAIAPGAVNTRFLDQALAAGEAAGADFTQKSIKQKEQGGVPPEKVAELAAFLASSQSDGLSGRLISLLWDNWREIPQHLDEIMVSDIYAMRRIIPKDRGFEW